MRISMTTMTVASLVALGLVGTYAAHRQERPQALFVDADSLFPNEKASASPPSTAQAPSTDVAKLSSAKSLFVPNDGSVSRQVAIQQYNAGHYYESIVSEVEGYRARLYNDNTGYAIGNGWNVSLQSQATNQRVTQAIGLSPSDSMELASLSGMHQPRAIPAVALTPEQATKAAVAMRAQFEEPMRKLVPSFDHLKPNEQAALVYHSYKVGGGAAKYTSMLTALKDYDRAPTDANRRRVADSFTYTYRMNGKVYTDQRSKLYLASLFTSPDAYGYLLGTTPAPANFSSIAKLAHEDINPSKSADGQIKDDFGQAKESLLKQGKVPSIDQEFKAAKREQTGYWF